MAGTIAATILIAALARAAFTIQAHPHTLLPVSVVVALAVVVAVLVEALVAVAAEVLAVAVVTQAVVAVAIEADS